jgi:2-dehydro-3-deoxygluconokinase
VAAAATAAPDILAIGEPMVELNQVERGGGGGGTLYLAGHGGDSSNCLVAAARQGARCGYVSAVGDDTFGRSLLGLWDREGVDRSGVIVRAHAPTGIYFVTHGARGHEFGYYRAGSAASLLRPDELPLGLIRGARVLHASGIGQAISTSACDAVFRAIRLAREAGALVSYDPNLRLRLWPLDRARAVIDASLRLADIALPGIDDARALTGLEDPDRICDLYLSYGCRMVLLTLGGEGCLAATPDARRRLPAHRVEAVDATGAGDTFDGAFLAEHLRTGGDVFRAAAYANAAAALATRGYGAVAPMPRRAEVEAFLGEAGA